MTAVTVRAEGKAGLLPAARSRGGGRRGLLPTPRGDRSTAAPADDGGGDRRCARDGALHGLAVAEEDRTRRRSPRSARAAQPTSARTRGAGRREGRCGLPPRGGRLARLDGPDGRTRFSDKGAYYCSRAHAEPAGSSGSASSARVPTGRGPTARQSAPTRRRTDGPTVPSTAPRSSAPGWLDHCNSGRRRRSLRDRSPRFGSPGWNSLAGNYI
jgi:hypothetical protein